MGLGEDGGPSFEWIKLGCPWGASGGGVQKTMGSRGDLCLQKDMWKLPEYSVCYVIDHRS